MAWCYILRCRDGGLYVGSTEDLEQRLNAHTQGCASVFTAKRLPVTLAYVESFKSADAARARERQIKGWTRVKKEALIADDRASLPRGAAGTPSDVRHATNFPAGTGPNRT